jgi:hypothetical protein
LKTRKPLKTQQIFANFTKIWEWSWLCRLCKNKGNLQAPFIDKNAQIPKRTVKISCFIPADAPREKECVQEEE